VLVHRKQRDLWNGLADVVGVESAQLFWDHVAQTPGRAPRVGSSNILKGKAGEPKAEGFSRTIHYEISGAGRINYQFNDAYIGRHGDPHSVVWILTIDHSSH
jgi:hypothetical protein